MISFLVVKITLEIIFSSREYLKRITESIPILREAPGLGFKLLARQAARVNQYAIFEPPLFTGRKCPVGEGCDRWINKSLLIDTPNRRVALILWVIENGDSVSLLIERPLDIAP